MDLLHGLDITLFPKIGRRSIEVHADVDPNIPHSIVQKSVLMDWDVQYESCEEPRFTDKKGRSHTPIGRVDLQWHKAGFLTENKETFYVVDSENPTVELKHGGDQTTDSGQQESQAQKKARVDKERAEEKKRQEERDREKHKGKGLGK
ncbi:MAG: hypothetical protein Q9169_006479 [Polycauliona sp. 2 TL-2023]